MHHDRLSWRKGNTGTKTPSYALRYDLVYRCPGDMLFQTYLGVWRRYNMDAASKS
jgi:hypothetical protein